MNPLFTRWNAHYVINSTWEKRRLHLTLDWTIIEKIPKIQQGRNYSHNQFIIMEKLANTSISKDIFHESLIQRKNFWIQKLNTLVPYGLNQELSKLKMKILRLSFHVYFYLDHSSQVNLELRWCHNIAKCIWHHVAMNKFRISINSLENGHTLN